MITIKYNENDKNEERDFYNTYNAIKFAYHLWRKRIEYKYLYKNIELIENSTWDFIELEKCIEVQIELIDKIYKGAE